MKDSQNIPFQNIRNKSSDYSGGITLKSTNQSCLVSCLWKPKSFLSPVYGIYNKRMVLNKHGVTNEH